MSSLDGYHITAQASILQMRILWVIKSAIRNLGVLHSTASNVVRKHGVAG